MQVPQVCMLDLTEALKFVTGAIRLSCCLGHCPPAGLLPMAAFWLGACCCPELCNQLFCFGSLLFTRAIKPSQAAVPQPDACLQALFASGTILSGRLLPT